MHLNYNFKTNILMSTILCMLLWTIPVGAQQLAILSKQKAPGITGDQYHLNLLHPDTHSVLNRVNLGIRRADPVLHQASSEETIWISRRLLESKEWELVALNTLTGIEVFKKNIGKRLPSPHRLSQHWFARSNDSLLIHTLVERKGIWWLDTNEFETGVDITSIKLGRGLIDVQKTHGGNILTSFANAGSLRRDVRLIEPKTGKVLYKNESKKDEWPTVHYAPNANRLYYITARRVSVMAQPPGERSKVVIRGIRSTLDIINASTGERSKRYKLGSNLTTLYSDGKNRNLYAASQSSLSKPGIKLWRIGRDDAVVKMQSDVYCKPTSVLVSEEQNLSTLSCENLVLHGNLSSEEYEHSTEFYFKASHSFYTKDNRFVYSRNKSGTAVAKIQLSPLRVVGRRSTGRTGVKVINAVGVVVGAALYAYTGYGYIQISGAPDASMLMDPQEEQLYIANNSTADLTILSSETFERLAAEPLGQLPAHLMNLETQPSVFALSRDQVSVFNPPAIAPKLFLKGGRFVGTAPQENRLYYATKKSLDVYNMSTLKKLASLSDLAGAYALAAISNNPSMPSPKKIERR